MIKKKKLAEAEKKEIEANNRTIKENNCMIKALQAENRLLRNRNRVLKGQHGKNDWNDSTPLFRFVNLNKSDAFNAMLKGWEPFLQKKIGTRIKSVSYFDFDLRGAANKTTIIRHLKKAMIHDPKVFTLSERKLCSYLSEHSNLGRADCIRKALQRCNLRKWGHKIEGTYVPAGNADV